MQLLLNVKVPNYLRKVELSKAQRVKPYVWNGLQLKAGSKLVPRKYLKKGLVEFYSPQCLRDGYYITMFKGTKPIVKFGNIDQIESSIANSYYNDNVDNPKVKFLLTDENHTVIPSNPKVAGTPRYTIINFQQLYSGNMHEHVRWKIMKEVKKSFLAGLKGKSPLERSDYPLVIELVAYDTVKNVFDRAKEGNGQRWDVGNRYYLYMKAFLDLLSNGYIEKDKPLFPPIIVDDDRLHVTEERVRFIPISADDADSRRLEFNIYTDTGTNTNLFIKPILKDLYKL